MANLDRPFANPGQRGATRGSSVNPYRARSAKRNNGGRNISRTERWLSAGAGATMVLYGLSHGRMGGLLAALIGGSLVYRGVRGRCECYAALGINTAEHNDATAVPAQEGYKVEKAIVINRPPRELYAFWREFENLPRVMGHLKSVESHDRQRSHWVAEGALGKDVEWDAEIINERENEMIAWRSLPEGDIETAGSVHFNGRDQDRATELVVSLKYNPPAGKLGAQVASLFGCGLENKITEDLARFKETMESGHASGVGAPSGGDLLGGDRPGTGM